MSQRKNKITIARYSDDILNNTPMKKPLTLDFYNSQSCGVYKVNDMLNDYSCERHYLNTEPTSNGVQKSLVQMPTTYFTKSCGELIWLHFYGKVRVDNISIWSLNDTRYPLLLSFHCCCCCCFTLFFFFF